MSYTQLELIPGMGWVRQPLVAKSEPVVEVVEEVTKAAQGYLPGMGIFNPAVGSGKVGATHHILTNSEAQEAIYAAEIAKHMVKAETAEEKVEEKSAPAVWLDFKIGDKIQTSQGVGVVEGIEADGSLTVKSQGRLFVVEKHLPGKHDQQSHAGGGSSASFVKAYEAARKDDPSKNFKTRPAQLIAKKAMAHLKELELSDVHDIGGNEYSRMILKDYHDMLRIASHVENGNVKGFRRAYGDLDTDIQDRMWSALPKEFKQSWD